jgi:hypothetical protein
MTTWRGGDSLEVGDLIIDEDEALQVSGGCEPLDDPLAPQRRQMRILCRPIPVRAAHGNFLAYF